MRKLIFVLLILILATETSAKCFKVMGGVNFSKYSGSLIGEEVWRFRTEFEVGAGHEITLGSHLALEVDGFLIQKGSKRKFIANGRYYYTIYYTLTEFSFPMLFKIKFKTDSSPYILGGGELSLILSHKREFYGVEIYYPPHHEEPTDTKSSYYGLIFGCGHDWKIGSISTFFEVRYNLSLMNILKSDTISHKPRAIVILIGFEF